MRHWVTPGTATEASTGTAVLPPGACRMGGLGPDSPWVAGRARAGVSARCGGGRHPVELVATAGGNDTVCRCPSRTAAPDSCSTFADPTTCRQVGGLCWWRWPPMGGRPWLIQGRPLTHRRSDTAAQKFVRRRNNSSHSSTLWGPKRIRKRLGALRSTSVPGPAEKPGGPGTLHSCCSCWAPGTPPCTPPARSATAAISCHCVRFSQECPSR